MREFLCAAILLSAAAARAAGETERLKGRVSFAGFYRYGCWSAYVPAEGSGELVLEAGAYRIRGGRDLPFNPGMCGADAVFVRRRGEVEAVVKGLRELKEEERLVLWFGYAPGTDEFLRYRKVGPYTFILLRASVPSRTPLLRNVDVIVVEKYPAAFHAPGTAARLTAWLVGGGTAVLTSREAMGMAPRSVFSPFFAPSRGGPFAAIRRKWREEKNIAPGDFWVIPAGLGRIVFFPADSPGIGIEAHMREREKAWREIGRLSAPRTFPREPARMELVRDVHALVPLSGDDFAVPGKGVVVFLYAAAAGGILFAARGWRRLAGLGGASVAFSGVILVFYAPPPVLTASLSLYGCRSGGRTVREYSFTQVCAFHAGRISFDTAGEVPCLPLIPEEAPVTVEETGGRMVHGMDVESLRIRTLYTERVSRIREPLAWSRSGDVLRVSLPGHLSAEACYFFTGGRLYAVPPAAGEYSVSGLRRVNRPEGDVLHALKAGRTLGLCTDDFLVVFVPGATGIRVDDAVCVRRRSVFFVGPGRG